ncbi:MAG TPA: GNAT family N-acetyltransferase [Bacillales bacterium]|nr:GNAT family N-acetyltransferase [Bacillales bacterium]
MLVHRELSHCSALFELMMDPAVFPYVRHKAYSVDEFMFVTKQTVEREANGELISRTILDETGNPIGTISLFDIHENTGYLATWIGRPYFGKGYNHAAKNLFFNELFNERDIHTVYLKINRNNVRSQKAAEKLPYVAKAEAMATETHVIYKIEKETYLLHAVGTDLLEA